MSARAAAAAIGLACLAACTQPVGGEATPGGVIAPGTPAGAGGAPAGQPATPGQGGSPRPVPSSAVTAADLTGLWVFGNGTEPVPGPNASCGPLQTMSLLQDGERVTGQVKSCGGLCTTLEDLDGRNVAGVVTLTAIYKGNLDQRATDVVYQLRYDPASQHLRGTREGRSYWAAPWVDAGPVACPPSPQVSPAGTR